MSSIRTPSTCLGFVLEFAFHLWEHDPVLSALHLSMTSRENIPSSSYTEHMHRCVSSIGTGNIQLVFDALHTSQGVLIVARCVDTYDLVRLISSLG